MEKRDYLMQQIEQLGQVLAKMLARLLGLRKQGNAALRINEIREQFKSELDLELELLQTVTSDELLELIVKQNPIFDHHLEILSTILSETAGLFETSGETDSALDLYRKALILLNHVDLTGKVYSQDRMIKIEELERRVGDS